MPWAFRPKTFDGTAIDDGSVYKSWFEFPDAPMRLIRRKPVELVIPGDFSFPESPRSQLLSAELTIHLEMRASLTDANVVALRKVFDRYKGFVPLVVEDGTPAEWTVLVKVEELREIDPAHWEIDLYTNRPVLLGAQKADSESGINTSPYNWNLGPSVAGIVRTYPTFTITPTAQKSDANDFTRRYQVSIAWRSELPGEDSVGNGYPIDIADGTFDTAAEVAAGRMQADGDDLRVYVDGVEYPRALNGINTANTKVWVPIHFAPRKQVLLAAAASGSSPATGTGTWNVIEGQSLVGWPERGSFLVDNERVWYGSRTDTSFSLLQRGYANTTAAAHSASAPGDWVEHDIEIVTDYSGAVVPTVVPSFAISIANSTNLAHQYLTTFASPTLQRYGQMALRYTADNVRAAGLSYFEGSSVMLFADKVPGGVNYPFNNVELYAPCGVKAAASALTFDITGGDYSGSPAAPGSDIMVNGRVFGIDIATGSERLLATYDKTARALGAAKTITPDAVLSRVRFNLIYNVITGAFRGDSHWADRPLNAAGHGVTDQNAQGIFLNQHTTIQAIALMSRENASGDTRNIHVYMRVGGSTPAGADELEVQDIVNAKLITTYRWNATDTKPNKVPQGAHYLMFVGQSGGAGTVYVAEYDSTYEGGSAWDQAGATWTDQGTTDNGFLLIGDGSVVQNEAPGGLEGYAAFDTVVVTFDNAAPRTPKIVRSAREDDIYIIRGTLSNPGLAGQSIAIQYICKLTESLTINVLDKLVSRNSSLRNYIPGVITPADPEEWLRVQPGADGLRWTETTPGTLTINTAWNDAWA